jgi:hypothetical protein
MRQDPHHDGRNGFVVVSRDNSAYFQSDYHDN